MGTRLQLLGAAWVATVIAIATPSSAEVMVGGAPMYASKTIVENAIHSMDHTTPPTSRP